jgi:hypothetical protein
LGTLYIPVQDKTKNDELQTFQGTFTHVLSIKYELSLYLLN